MTAIREIFDSIRSVHGITGRVTASCVACGSTRLVSAQAWSGDSKPDCLWCAKPMYHAHPEQLVTLIGTFHNGKQVDDSEPKQRKKKIVKPKYRSRWRSDNTDLPPKPEYTNQPRESVAKKPEVKLAPIVDRSHSQEWRNAPEWWKYKVAGVD